MPRAERLGSFRRTFPHAKLLLIFAGLVAAVPSRAHSSESGGRVLTAAAEIYSGSCWSRQTPETFEEVGHDQANRSERASRQARISRAIPNAMLALSSGRLRGAYGAGLIVGWGETGYRPDFATVTAVGLSALIAPFVFAGPDFDQTIADIFNCKMDSWGDVARLAASRIDKELLERIARKHEAGGRLLVALEGSAARPEVVWDIGRIAASHHPQAAHYIGEIMLAAIDGVSFLAPETVPIPAGLLVERNRTFRKIGAGEAFLLPHQAQTPASHYYVIHNGVLFRDESEQYAKARRTDAAGGRLPNRLLVPAYDLLAHANAQHASFRFAAIKPRLGLQSEGDFNITYMRDLFAHAYRQGRMNKEWKAARGDSDVVSGAHDQ
jgi:hypothetical protein